VLVPIDSAFAANSMNHVAFRQNSLLTVGEQQFATYYDSSGLVTIARRDLGSTAWDIFNTVYVDNNSNLSDDHDVITFGVDGDGFMHLTWGMHDDELRYIRSNAPVTGNGAIAFGDEIEMTGEAEGLVTYPQFYHLPDGDLLYMYRTGGSGNGDTQLNRYDTATNTWSPIQRPLYDGSVQGDDFNSVNAYANTLAFDSQGNIHFTWTVRETPEYQTNHDFFHAMSPDNGTTWTTIDGTPIGLPLEQANTPPVFEIPQGSSLINQTSSTVDANDNPLVASWWAPSGGRGTGTTRQYMLAYYDGQEWQMSQITDRAFEPQQGAGAVRELARPIVVVDDDNRVIVAMRYDERDDVVTIAHSLDRENWSFLDLTTEALGTWEPNYDPALWARENKLHLLYQPVGLGQTNSTISVLEWDAAAYFAGLVSADLKLRVDRATGEVTIVNVSGNPGEFDRYTIASASGQLDPSSWNSFEDQQFTGWQQTQQLNTLLSEQNNSGQLELGGNTEASIGAAFAGDPIAFGVDGEGDLVFEFALDDGSPLMGEVEYVGESSNNLTLVVDPNDGRTFLQNTSPFDVNLDGYTVFSESGALLFADGNWKSLDDEDAAGGDWVEANNVDENRVTEFKLAGATFFEDGELFDLGQLFDPGGEQDLLFQFTLEGEALTRDGVVRFAALTVPVDLAGDYNDDGIVNAADYVAWRNAFGQTVNLPNDETPGTVDEADYAVWRENFGSELGEGNVAAVPEPTAMWLFGIAALGLFARAPCVAPGHGYTR
jgi:hypothetical protein